MRPKPAKNKPASKTIDRSFKPPKPWEGHRETLKERLSHPNKELHRLIAKIEEADAKLSAARARKLLNKKRKTPKRKK
ncbi:MAG: hypothetical protein Q7S21_07855 [archaeon]|nr:hypothetical protein [archaeon]